MLADLLQFSRALRIIDGFLQRFSLSICHTIIVPELILCIFHAEAQPLHLAFQLIFIFRKFRLPQLIFSALFLQLRQLFIGQQPLRFFLFNLAAQCFRLPAVLLLPFSGLFANLAERLVPDKSADAEDAQLEDQLKELDPHLVVSPSLALDLTAKLVGNMSDLALHNYTGAVQQIYEFDPQRSKRIDQREHMLDRMTDASSQYVVAVSPHITLERDTKEQNFLLKAITAFERIGDLAVNITDNVYALRDMDKSFSPYAMEELRVVIDAVQKNLDYTVTAYKNDDMEAARQVEPLEEVIDEMIEYLKAQHVDRMTRGLCDILGGIQFQNILSNLERISDQCSNVGVYTVGLRQPDLLKSQHDYIRHLHQGEDRQFNQEYSQLRQSYFQKLNVVEETE